MPDKRPSLDRPFTRHGLPATVTIGDLPFETRAIELGRVNESGEIGAWSLTKSRRRLRLRLDQLPPAGRADVSWPPPGTTIVFGGATLHVDGTHYSDGDIVDVLVR